MSLQNGDSGVPVLGDGPMCGAGSAGAAAAGAGGVCGSGEKVPAPD